MTVTVESLSILYEEYENLERLGSGKFGSVYKVIQRETGKMFAAKHVKCRRASEKKRMMEEVDILGSINHSKIMRLYRVFADIEDGLNDEIVLILEYLSGGDLYSRIMHSDDVFTEADISRFIRQIILGLHHIHASNVVHLDIKPENIVCENLQDFDIKIVDFGLSRRLAEDADICVMQGTPDFVSPEVINYEPIGAGSDMWSVGVITYVLLSGLSPFLGNSNIETFSNITNCNYTLDEEQFDIISCEGKDFIQKLLVLEPSRRMTAAECLEHPWLVSAVSRVSEAKLRWSKYTNTIRAVRRFRAVEKEV